MKKTMPTLPGFLIMGLLVFGAGPAPAAEEAPPSVDFKGGEVLAAETPEPPPFTLSPAEGDSPALTRRKAALRLLKAYQVTDRTLQLCAPSLPEAVRARNLFRTRNGNTLALVMNVVRQTGGPVTPEIQALLAKEGAAETEARLAEGDCPAQAERTVDGEYDLYKSPALADDYQLLRKR